MNAEITIIGSELLLGQIIDTNASYIAQKLAEIGINLYFKTTVGDNFERMKSVLINALKRSEIIITSGGLGPTEDDLTREVISEVTGRELILHKDILNHIESLFNKLGFKMSENNKKQAFLPKEAIPIENPIGTAPGFVLEHENKVIISLPGVPSELKLLMEKSVIPYLKERFQLKGIIKSRVLKTVEITEGRVDELIKDLMKRGPNPTVGVLAYPSGVEIRITAKGDNMDEVMNLIRIVEDDIRNRLKDYIYGADKETLEEVVKNMLKERNLTISVLETCTAGKLSQKLLDSETFKGGFVVNNEDGFRRFSKDYDVIKADPDKLTLSLSNGIREAMKADISLAIISRDSRTYVSLSAKEYGRTKSYGFDGWRGMGPDRSVALGLNMVRKYLI
jgi:nicotinamide-nucleotide amidase